MTFDERPPTDAELRDAELLARALEDPAGPGTDLAPVEDAVAAAWMLRASRRDDLAELRARAVLDRVWKRRTQPIRSCAAAGALAVAAAAAVAIVALRPRGPAELPPASVPLLQAQLAAARPGATGALAPLERQMAAYREQVYSALGRAYGARR
jgi:hypothetical protein